MDMFCEFGNNCVMDAEWIRKQLETHPEKSQAGLARALGVDPSAVTRLLKGARLLKAHEIPVIEAFFNTSAPAYQPTATVVDVGDFPSSIVDVKGKEYASIPVYDVRFSAGFGAQNDAELPLDYHEISMSTLRRFTDAPLNKLVFLRVSGDSMEPLLYNRDWVLVDARRTNLVSPAIYAIVFEGEGFLKHASRNLETGAVTLASQNPLYPPQTIAQPEGLRIIGRVVMSMHMH